MLNNQSLYFVTPDNEDCDELVFLCKGAIEGGVDIIQLRYKKENTRDFLSLAQKLSLLCQSYSIPLIINDRVDIALAVGADGVHLGQSDMPIAIARQLLGEKAIIGLSIEALDQIENMDIAHADYLAASPVFYTKTKKDIKPPLGLEGLSYIVERTKKPIVAIGGIEKEHIKPLIQKGAQMIAVVSAISHAANPKQAAQELKEEINQWRNNDLVQF